MSDRSHHPHPFRTAAEKNLMTQFLLGVGPVYPLANKIGLAGLRTRAFLAELPEQSIRLQR
jgi:hypothetical protein